MWGGQLQPGLLRRAGRCCLLGPGPPPRTVCQCSFAPRGGQNGVEPSIPPEAGARAAGLWCGGASCSLGCCGARAAAAARLRASWRAAEQKQRVVAVPRSQKMRLPSYVGGPMRFNSPAVPPTAGSGDGELNARTVIHSPAVPPIAGSGDGELNAIACISSPAVPPIAGSGDGEVNAITCM